MNPFKYRPEHLVRDPDLPEAPDDIEWEDNAISNFMAWFSQLPPLEPMCNEKEYLSSRFANYFYTSCPCCLFYRGLIIGAFISSVLWTIIIGTVYWVYFS